MFCAAPQLLEFFPELVESVKQERFLLSDAEANVLLPCLVEKVTDADG